METSTKLLEQYSNPARIWTDPEGHYYYISSEANLDFDLAFRSPIETSRIKEFEDKHLTMRRIGYDASSNPIGLTNTVKDTSGQTIILHALDYVNTRRTGITSPLRITITMMSTLGLISAGEFLTPIHEPLIALGIVLIGSLAGVGLHRSLSRKIDNFLTPKQIAHELGISEESLRNLDQYYALHAWKN